MTDPEGQTTLATNSADPAVEETSKAKPLWQRLLPLAVIVAGAVAVYLTGAHQYLSFQALSDHRETLTSFVQEHFIVAISLYVLAYAVSVALSLPGAVFLTIAGGFMFGLITGTLATVVGATIGAVAVFIAAKTALGDTLRGKVGPWLTKFEQGFSENALSYLLVLRLVPLFPFWLVNLVPAFLGVKLRTYALATFFGIMPGSFVFVSVGNGLGAVFERGETPDLSIIFSPSVLIPILGLAVLSLIPVAYKKLRAGKATQN
ncbi:MAG: TVP38/TMEM64 family protein [Alphaproteobacteria bacterium]|nr:TVP38/TMEM64 family protein [Alphaproteobacteria bacterium SS10]